MFPMLDRKTGTISTEKSGFLMVLSSSSLDVMILLNSQNVRFFTVVACSSKGNPDRLFLGLFSFARLLTVVLDEHYLFTRKRDNLGSISLVTTVACSTLAVSFVK